jgi:2,3-bisphosphoglycerate-independent phosphoglycerate mutase
MNVEPPKFVILAILDGWGIAPESPGNAITQSKTINMDKFSASYPHTELEASGDAVGLPKGEDGNTETGHLNLGAGKIVYQDLQRINLAIADETFYKNKVLLGAIEHAKANKSRLHFMGLVGAGGVHSNIEHIFALLHLAKMNSFSDVFVHVFTDGRDSPPTAAKSYLKQLEDQMQKEGVGKIASIMGRYYAMDRDQRWNRTARAYDALTKGQGELVKTPEEAIDASYSNGITDEFIIPSIIDDGNGKPLSLISNNDAVVFFNFRIDRPRQLTKAFTFKDLKNADLTYDFDPYIVKYAKKHIVSKPEPSAALIFDRGAALQNLYFVTMTDYGKQLVDSGAIPAFPPEVIKSPLSGLISDAGFSQLKITESEKERFVTFYFNGLREAAYPLEKRVIVSSPMVPTYDQKPQMSTEELLEALFHNLSVGDYRFVVINFPNADMVGHTGNIGAAVSAIETIDHALGKIANYVLAYNGALFITADHGNVEEMINLQTGGIDTEHSINRVPFIAVSNSLLGKSHTLNSGILADVAPTILGTLGISQPSSMTGRDLLKDVRG